MVVLEALAAAVVILVVLRGAFACSTALARARVMRLGGDSGMAVEEHVAEQSWTVVDRRLGRTGGCESSPLDQRMRAMWTMLLYQSPPSIRGTDGMKLGMGLKMYCNVLMVMVDG